jgi:hypothetical protein
MRRVSADCELQHGRAAVELTDDLVGADRTGGIQLVDELVRRRCGVPTGGPRVDRPPHGSVLGGVDAEVCGLDPQRGVVRHHQRGRVSSLPERGTDDPVVGHGGVESVFEQQVLLDAVDLDVHGRRVGCVGHRDRCRERTAGPHAEFFDGPQRGACRSSDVVETRLEPVEFLDHRERDHHVDTAEAGDRARVGDQHRGVEHHSRPGAGRGGTTAGSRLVRGRVDGWAGEHVGHGHSSIRAPAAPPPAERSTGGWRGSVRRTGSTSTVLFVARRARLLVDAEAPRPRVHPPFTFWSCGRHRVSGMPSSSSTPQLFNTNDTR